MAMTGGGSVRPCSLRKKLTIGGIVKKIGGAEHRSMYNPLK
jgi:hypothetical protein